MIYFVTLNICYSTDIVALIKYKFANEISFMVNMLYYFYVENSVHSKF